MTSGLQPTFSGAPIPVQGVTGGPPALGGQIGNDPQTGNVVISPNPGQVLQVRKGNNPTALQVYEYFNSNTNYSRIALNSQTGGPFQLAVETAPSTVIRDLNINTNGNLVINAASTSVGILGVTGASTFSGTAIFNSFVGVGGTPLANNRLTVIGIGATLGTNSLIVKNGNQSLTQLTIRDDGLVALGAQNQILIGNVVGAIGFFASGGSPKLTVTGAKGGNVALGSLMSALSAYGLVTDSTTA